MNLEEAQTKYGAIQNGVWAREGEFCSLLKIPPDISENWINTATSGPTTKIYCNKDIQAALLSALQNVRDRGLLHELKTFDGGFNIRDVRSQPGKPSTHSYGLAIDINAATNQLGSQGDIPPQLVECFTNEGWIWGGNFPRRDFMHFQYLAEW